MRIFPLTLLCLAPAVVLAQTESPLFTVDEAVQLAIQHNPRIGTASREIVAARYGVRSARALTNPQIEFAPAITNGGSDEEFRVQQPLELNGIRSARTGVAAARLRGTEADAITELRNLVFSVKSAYYELARARERLALAHDLLGITEELDRLTRRQVEVGTRPTIDQTQTGIEVTRARQGVTQAEAQVRISEAALNTLMGRNPADPIASLAPIPREFPFIDHEAALRDALAQRAEIKSAEAAVEVLRQEGRQARAEGKPDLVPQFRATSVTKGVEEAGIGIAITLPIFDYGSRRHRVRQSEEEALAQRERVTATQNQIRQEVEQALAQRNGAESVLKEYRQGLLDQARKLLDASRIGYEEGATPIVALLDAQRTFRNVQSEYIDAQVAYALTQAELERAIGTASPDMLFAPPPKTRETN